MLTWASYIEKIEEVKERYTQILYGFSELSFEERLRLTTLKDGRARRNLIEI